MKEDPVFENIGKKITYEVPEGFFETISQKTLQQVKQRELRHKKVFLTGFITVAASLALLVSLTFFILRQSSDRNKEELTGQKMIEAPQKFKQEILDNSPVTGQKLQAEKLVPKRTTPAVQEQEKIDDLLPHLSEEDLLQLAALYKADPFSE